ncbi:MAG: alkaline phosphatase family protein [Acidobacteriota bacterium]|nr:alkaline phosphatase family protein [Acidobacteriota bacterium]
MTPSVPPRIFVLIDALGWRYASEAGFLEGILDYRTPLRTVLGFSSAAIPTILTGLAPSRHGHWNLLYYDPEGSPFRRLRPLALLPDAVVNNRIIRRVITETGRRVMGLGPAFDCTVSPRLLPWFNWTETRDIYARGGIAGAQSFFDLLAARGIAHRVFTYRHARDREIVRQAADELKAGRSEVLFLYLSELDMLLHGECDNRREWSAALARYETGLRRLFELALRRNERATLAVFSDHGMTPVRQHRAVASEIRRLGFRMPEEYLAVYDSTMARFWFFSEDARRAITERLEAITGGRILSDEELERLGVFFADRRHGELIYLLDPGRLLVDSDFHNGGWKPAGMHGYHPDDPDSDGIFLSNVEPATPIRAVADVHAFLVQSTLEETHARGSRWA